MRAVSISGEQMKAYEYFLSRQIQWATNQGIALIGSKGERGRCAYTLTLEQNLFKPLVPDVRKYFEGAVGGELRGIPSKMQAVHSSSAIAVNIFQYRINRPYITASACGFCRKGQSFLFLSRLAIVSATSILNR